MKESTQRIPLWPSCARALCCYLALLVFSRRFSALLPCVVSFLCFFAHLSCPRRVQLAVCISTVARVSLLTRVVSFLCFVFYTCSGAPGNMLCDKFYCALFTTVVSFFYASSVSFVLRARVLCVVTYRCYLRVVTSALLPRAVPTCRYHVRYQRVVTACGNKLCSRSDDGGRRGDGFRR